MFIIASSSYFDIYYCMTGRAIQGNIQFEGGSIVRPKRNAIIDLLYDSNLVGKKWKGRGKGKRKREEKERKK